MAYYLLRTDPGFVESLGESLRELRSRIRPCAECGNYTEQAVCEICSDSGRDQSVVCVVEQPQDISVLEASREYRGLYHALMGVISPIDGVGPEDLTIGKLIERIRRLGISEVILATNPTVEGDTTALYVAKQIEQTGARASRLALGLPVGGDLEYADRLTIGRALRGRTNLGGDE
jgi:recombination protein RecR